MLDKNFQKAPKVFWQDHVLDIVILWLIPKWIFPNHVTMFRFMATPIVLIFVLYESYLVGLILFLLVAFTDAIDGALARTRNQITVWGKIYDPLADKILIGCMVFAIVLRYIDLWTAFLIIILEIIIITVAWFRKRRGAEIQANVWGKIKMALQVLGVVILLLSIVFNWAALLPLASGVLYLAIAFAVVSLLTYGI